MPIPLPKAFASLLSYVVTLSLLPIGQMAWGQSRYAASDNMSGFVHWIDLYDENNTRIDPTAENPRPYSPEKTCGRCHDQATISHGWHFDAVEADARQGRSGQPWIWNDPRTGTHLPLSFRDWEGTYNPDELGLTRWEVAAKFGGYLPGGGPGAESALGQLPEVLAERGDDEDAQASEDGQSQDAEGESSEQVSQAASSASITAGHEAVDRSSVTGPLPVDCMICHNNPGSGYSPFVWTEQIDSENFAYAPTAALGIATVSGSMSRLRDDFDPNDEETADQLPTVNYEASRFREDGKAFIDLVRTPSNDACYYCHTNIDSGAVTGTRWLHDEDIHLRAGIKCADCHRNGLDHETVRGYPGEEHPAGASIASLSCQGCHLGSGETTDDRIASDWLAERAAALGRTADAAASAPASAPAAAARSQSPEGQAEGDQAPVDQASEDQANADDSKLADRVAAFAAPGRLGAPRPAHAGLPPVHFEVMSCTSCHSGPMPSQQVGRQMNSIAHRLGLHEKRTGEEPPAIFASIALRPSQEAAGSDATKRRYTPQRLMWPSFWGTIGESEVVPLNPELAYMLTRRSLRVRRDFTKELSEVRLPLSTRRELLGDDRVRAGEEEWTAEERAKIEAAEAVEREQKINEAIFGALEAIEQEFPERQAVFISGGVGFVRDTEIPDSLTTLSREQLGAAAEPYAWPLAHNVRSAQRSIGATGCAECHSEGSKFFSARLTPVGMLPEQETSTVSAHQMQEVDVERLNAWNQLFLGRSLFKIAGILALGFTALITVSAIAWNLSHWLRR